MVETVFGLGKDAALDAVKVRRDAETGAECAELARTLSASGYLTRCRAAQAVVESRPDPRTP